MQKYFGALSRRGEFVIVVLVAFGQFIVRSLWAAVHPATLALPHHTGASLLFMTAWELVVLLALGLFLYARGWSLEKVDLKITPMDTLLGFGLAAFIYVVGETFWAVLAISWPDAARTALQFKFANEGLPLATMIATCLVNPLYEELFVAGYVITALKDSRWSGQAVNVSTAIRLSYHLYQGIPSVVFVLPTGLILGYWYKQHGRLWPLIACHALLDFISLSTLVRV